jgi:glycosyl transferase family 25
MTLNIPAYLINLDGSDARLESTTQQLNDAGIEFTRVPAFDGRNIPNKEIDGYDAQGAMTHLGRGLSGGEIGCYKSHLMVIEKFLQTDSEYGIAFEDDIEVNPLLMQEVKQLIGVFEAEKLDWDIVHLGARANKLCRELTWTDQFQTGTRIMHAHYFPQVTSGLLWSRKGAESFLETYNRVDMPIDTKLREVMVRNNRGYCFWPALVKQTDDDESDIDGNSGPRRMHERHWAYGFKKQKRLMANKFHAIKNGLLHSNS